MPDNVKTITVNFFQGDLSGWINWNLTLDGVTHKLWASAVFPPFADLVRFLEDVAAARLPAKFELDEEGVVKVFSARAEVDPNLFHFALGDPEAEPPLTLVEGTFERRQFVTAFYTEYVDFVATRFQPERWRDSDSSPHTISLTELKQLIDRLN